MRFTNEFTDEKLLCILKHSPKIKFDQGATPEESLVSFSSSYQYGTNLMKLGRFHFRKLKILLYRDRNKSSNPYLDNVMFNHLK